MKRNAGIFALVLVVSLLGASDVRGFALVPAGQTAGPALTAAVVIDVTEGDPTNEGLSSIRVQKSASSAAVFFVSVAYVRAITWNNACIALGLTGQPVGDLEASTQGKFVGKMDGWVPAPELASLVGQFGDPSKSAITDTDTPSCTSINGRRVLSFQAVIHFEK